MYEKFCSSISGFPSEKYLKSYAFSFTKSILVALTKAVNPVGPWKRAVNCSVAIEKMVSDYYSGVAGSLVGMYNIGSL